MEINPTPASQQSPALELYIGVAVGMDHPGATITIMERRGDSTLVHYASKHPVGETTSRVYIDGTPVEQLSPARSDNRCQQVKALESLTAKVARSDKDAERALWNAFMADCGPHGSTVPRSALHTASYRAAHRDGWMDRASEAQERAPSGEGVTLTGAEAEIALDYMNEAAKHRFVSVEEDAVRDKLARRATAGEAQAESKYPHPDCDWACHYHCTEAGAHLPDCVKAEHAPSGEVEKINMAQAGVGERAKGYVNGWNDCVDEFARRATAGNAAAGAVDELIADFLLRGVARQTQNFEKDWRSAEMPAFPKPECLLPGVYAYREKHMQSYGTGCYNAGWASQLPRIRHLERERDIARACIASNAATAAPGDLTDERIGELYLSTRHIGHATNRELEFARAIEREVLASNAGAAPGWISVEERSPEFKHECTTSGCDVSDTVMVYGESEFGTNGCGFGHARDDGTWVCYEAEYDQLTVVRVTHWMPLPAAPSNPPGKP